MCSPDGRHVAQPRLTNSGVAADVGRDFLGVGVANIAAGLVGAFPVNSSPARTTVSRLAGGSTKLVGATAAILLVALSPLITYARAIPLAALAGVLFFIALRLIKVDQMTRIWRTSRTEFVFAIVTLLGVIVIGVDWGLGLAVALAVAQQTARTSRPHLVELGRRTGTTSWEPLHNEGVVRVPHIVAALFDHDLFFANAEVFRKLLHGLMSQHPHCQVLVLDCEAMADIDFTGLSMLADVVDDLAKDGSPCDWPARAITCTTRWRRHPTRRCEQSPSTERLNAAATGASV